MPSFLTLFQQTSWVTFSLGMVCCAVLAFIVHLLTSNRSQRRTWTLSLRLERLQEEYRQTEMVVDRLRTERNALARECRTLDTENAALRTDCAAMQRHLSEREVLLASTREQIERDFQLLASKILGEKGEHLNRQHESSLNLLLRPFHDQLLEFKRKVEEVHAQDARDRVAMTKEIEHLKQLNQQVSTDAANLAAALRGGNKLQGLWGEMILAKLLEASGLRNGKEFVLQTSLKSEDGQTFQPDVLVHLPDNRLIIIDAKVSLKAFAEAHAAEEGPRKLDLVRQHVHSVKQQVALLASKKYQQLSGPGALDFVLLFLPVEGAFQLAVEQDPELLIQAMQQKVLLTSPSTLLAILRTIQYLWRLDEQNRNSFLIAKQAGNLYDKFVGFAETFEEIGLRLNQTQQAWHTAKNRLSSGRGNLISRAENLKHLGVQPTRELPETLKSSAPEQDPCS